MCHLVGKASLSSQAYQQQLPNHFYCQLVFQPLLSILKKYKNFRHKICFSSKTVPRIEVFLTRVNLGGPADLEKYFGFYGYG